MAGTAMHSNKLLAALVVTTLPFSAHAAFSARTLLLVSGATTELERIVDGRCVSRRDDEASAHRKCKELLVGSEPKFLVQLPGGIFLGGAFGPNGKYFVLAPQVSFSAGASVPLRTADIESAGLNDDAAYVYEKPSGVVWGLDGIIALNGLFSNLIAFGGNTSHYLSGPADSGGGGGFLLGTQIYLQWPSGTRIALSLSVYAGYLFTEKIGHSFLLALQPTFVFQPRF